MIDLPRVAILLATYNGRQWIEQQIDSIFAQQGVAWTLVIADDGSVDGTREFLESVAASHDNIVLLPPAPPSGSSAANFSACCAPSI